ncbi:MAG TPA: response regulator transcription factor [Gemmatimonadales bacterium]|jgi:DNA-binding NarL/FixJ family response regulator|nr:response regulator transcription factor [Gemmatimonadales bacterium]
MTAETRRLWLVIADDHLLVATGLARMLYAHHDIAGVALSGRSLVAILEQIPVDCVLLDISMPEQGGLDVLPELRLRWPKLKIVMLTMHNDRALADAALQLGADGYLPKDIQLEELLVAIDQVVSGRTYVSPRVPRHTDNVGIQALHPSLLSLTPRQEQVLTMVSDGKSTAAIAGSLNLSESTVTFHRANIRKKLGITTDHGLHAFASLIRQMLRERETETQG